MLFKTHLKMRRKEKDVKHRRGGRKKDKRGIEVTRLAVWSN